jgi:hypothetical protein
MTKVLAVVRYVLRMHRRRLVLRRLYRLTAAV